MKLPRLYRDLARWWPLLSPPAEYRDEAAWILEALTRALGRPPATILELGSGGGNTALFLAPHAKLTLVDLSPEMLAVSRQLIPNAEHVEGDMRTVRLGRVFDAVLMHDAIMYMTTRPDLVAALATARAHLAGGAAIALPDCVAETFAPGIETGGAAAPDGNAARFLEWTHAPAPGATAYDVDYALLLRDAAGAVETIHDRHRCGLFSRAAWRKAFADAGFAVPGVLTDPWKRTVFVARPAA
jgi:SAM-dependent methyltransferase